MRIKNKLAILAGAVALACSGGAIAQTSAGPNGTIFINIVDTSSGTSFLFDTGLLVSSFTGSTSYSVNLATNSASSAAYAAFVASETGSSDTIDYSVVGNYAPTSGTPLDLTLSTAISNLGLTQGIVGAGENKLNYAITLAQSQITNFSAAESGIKDADVAAEAANLTKAQVLQQASLAALAQANSAPQAVLSLLKG